MKKKSQKKQKSDCLIGRCFHSVKDGVVEWQGEVIGRVSDEQYLVQLYDYVVGQPSVQRIVNIKEMSSWLFYSDEDELKYSYEHGAAAHLRSKTQEQSGGR